MIKKISIVILILCCGFSTQKKKKGNEIILKNKYEKFIERTLDLIGYTTIKIELVENINIERIAVAFCKKNSTPIHYNPNSLEKINNSFGFGQTKIKNISKDKTRLFSKDWSSKSVLVHELGHVIQNHCTKYPGIEDRKQAEIEADIFMGKTMHMLGATLKEAQNCMYDDAVKTEETLEYPSRTDRLLNVKKGWDNYIIKDESVEDNLALARNLFLAGGRRNYKAAFSLFKKNKKGFTANDMYIFGVMHIRGYGTRKNFKESLVWLKASYILGNEKAFYLYRLLFY